MTYADLALAAGAKPEQVDDLLWNYTAFPMGGARIVWYQLRRAIRAFAAGYTVADPQTGQFSKPGKE